jgi:hypothetical protein
MLAKGPDHNHDTHESKYPPYIESKYDSNDVVDYDDPVNNPFVAAASAPRKSGRAKTMSSAGAASVASVSDTYYFTANVLQSIITSAPDPGPSVYGDALKLMETSVI